MKILAIETSCDETACAVVENGRTVLSNVVATQIKEHIVYGGVVPEIASRMHTNAISAVCGRALSDAGVSLGDIDAVAVTYAPGLIGALLTGVSYAKSLAYAAKKPLIATHHLRSHIAACYLTYPKLEPPFLSLVVSGGHTHLVKVNSYTELEVIGKTRDDAAGEAMDKAARTMGLDYPGGLNLDRVSVNGNSKAFSFPHPKVAGSEFDFSFSGMKTSVINLIHNASQKGEQLCVADVGASFISAVADCLCDAVERAAIKFSQNKIVLAGGVSANSVLRKRMNELCSRRSWGLYLPKLCYCGDNAAMVGAQAYYEYLAGSTAPLSLNASAAMPIEA